MRRVLNIPQTQPKTRRGTARDVVAGLAQGDRIVAIVEGTASLMDVVEAALEITGPGTLDLGSWTIGLPESERLAGLIASGEVTRVRLVVDRSFRQFRDYYARLMELVGPESVVQARSHTKFVVIRNDTWDVVIRSSMNANLNLRIEHVDAEDCAEVADLFTTFVDDLFREG